MKTHRVAGFRRLSGPALSALLALSASSALAPPVLAQPKKPPEAGVVQQDVSLAVGESKTLNASDVKEFKEGRPGIADVRLSPDGTKFIIAGLKAGATSLVLFKNDGTQVNVSINVFSRQPDAVERELGELLDGYPGIKIRRIGQRVFIEGGVASEAEAKRIQQIAGLYSGQVESLVTVGVGSAERSLNVRIDFFFVQYSKSTSYRVGVDWPGRIGGEAIQSEFTFDFLQGQAVTAQASVVNQPLPALDVAARRGWIKVMKQASVITTNGSEATFENGGEVNVPISAGFSAAIQRIPFGTNVTVLPRFDPGSRNLEVKVQADVADLTPALVSTVPGRQTSRLSTLVFLKLGQSLVLSGIKTRTQRHGVRGLPLLSQVPVLGVLFGSHDDEQDDVEGAVFVIPSVVESVPKSTYDIVKEAMKQYENFDGDLDDVNTFQKTPPSSAEPAPEE